MGAGPLVAKLAGEAHARLHEFSDIEMATLVWGFARLQFREPWVLKAVAQLARADMATFSPQAMSNLVWAYAKLQHHPGAERPPRSRCCHSVTSLCGPDPSPPLPVRMPEGVHCAEALKPCLLPVAGLSWCQGRRCANALKPCLLPVPGLS